MVDFIIKLFKSTDTSFETNGIGFMSDATKCIVTEERNGSFELEMRYPVNGVRYQELYLRRILLAKPNPYSDPQPFRIYSISKPINGIITVNAEHLSYDMNGFAVSPYKATSLFDAFNKLKSSSVVDCPFNFLTDKDVSSSMNVNVPTNMRSLLGGIDGSFLDLYGGEYEFDGYNVILWKHRGSNRGVVIRYGKNLTDLDQEENCSNVYTGVYPYWYSEYDDKLVQLPEKVVYADGTYDFNRILALDLSEKWEEEPSVDSLRTYAQKYIVNNDIGIPKVSLTVSFVNLSQTEEYKDIVALETVKLCDTVGVEFPEMGVSASAKCIKTVYDVLSDRYESIELGNTKSNMSTTIIESERNSQNTSNRAINNTFGLIDANKSIQQNTTDIGTANQKIQQNTTDIGTANQKIQQNTTDIGKIIQAINAINSALPYTIVFDGTTMTVLDSPRSI